MVVFDYKQKPSQQKRNLAIFSTIYFLCMHFIPSVHYTIKNVKNCHLSKMSVIQIYYRNPADSCPVVMLTCAHPWSMTYWTIGES